MSLSDDAREAISWQETTDLGRVGYGVAAAAIAAVLPDGRTIAQALDEVDVLGQCVQSLYQWIVEFDRDLGPVTDYLSAPHAEVADAACAKWRNIDWTDR